MPSRTLPRLLLRFIVPTIEAVGVSWLYQHRREVMTRLGRRAAPLPDTTRPLGDRAVAMVPGPGPSPFQSAVADSAPRPTSAVVRQEQHSNAQTRIDQTPELSPDHSSA